MNILVLSDSHGHPEKIRDAVKKQINKPDAVIFLGDGLRDIDEDTLGVPVYSVCGNCDAYSLFMPSDEPEERILELGGKRIMMTHGHRYSVKSGLGRIIAVAAMREVDLLLFGHTHEKLELYFPAGACEYGIELKRPLYVMNPGSIGEYQSSFGCIMIDGNGSVLLSHG